MMLTFSSISCTRFLALCTICSPSVYCRSPSLICDVLCPCLRFAFKKPADASTRISIYMYVSVYYMIVFPCLSSNVPLGCGAGVLSSAGRHTRYKIVELGDAGGGVVVKRRLGLLVRYIRYVCACV